MAINLQESFLTESQSMQSGLLFSESHQVPKTIAIIETSAYTTFLNAWESLSETMEGILAASSDIRFATVLSRTRTNTLSFNGYLDSQPTTPSLMDIGQFFDLFNKLCNVDPASSLREAMDTAISAYNNMYVARGIGPGTSNATGMAILWPYQSDYDYNPELWDSYLFDSKKVFATIDSPKWLSFLQTYLNIVVPTSSSNTSVCLNKIENTIEPIFDDQLILNLNTSLETPADLPIVTLSTEVMIETDQVRMTFGYNQTSILSDNTNNRNRRIMEKLEKYNSRQHTMTTSSSNCQHERLSPRSSNFTTCHEHLNTRPSTRRTGLLDRFYIYGGDMQVEFDGPVVSGKWDRLFYILNASNSIEPIFISDKGNGQKAFPVCYFSPSTPISPSDLESYIDAYVATIYYGCIQGEITFSTEQETFVPTLYIYDSQTGTYSELSVLNGGQIAPIVYLYYSQGGTELSNIVGGFQSTIFDWSYDTDFSIIGLTDTSFSDVFETDNTIFVVEAYDYDIYNRYNGTGYDYLYYYIPKTDTGSSFDLTKSPSIAPIPNATDNDGVVPNDGDSDTLTTSLPAASPARAPTTSDDNLNSTITPPSSEKSGNATSTAGFTRVSSNKLWVGVIALVLVSSVF